MLSPATAAKVTTALADRLAVRPTVEGFAGRPVPRAGRRPSRAVSEYRGGAEPRGVGGNRQQHDRLRTRHRRCDRRCPAVDRLAQGAATDIDVLIGSNDDEHALFFVPSGLIDYVTDEMVARVLTGVGADADAVAASYRLADRPRRPARS